MLRKPIGINGDKRKDISLLDAVLEGRLDTCSGLPIDKATLKTIPMEKALQNDVITPRGAAVLKSLLNITVTTATVTQTVKRQMSTSSRHDDDGELNGQQIMTTSMGSTNLNSSTISFTQSESSQQRIFRGSSVSSLSAISDKRASVSSHTTTSAMTKSGGVTSSSTSSINQRKTSNVSSSQKEAAKSTTTTATSKSKKT